MILTPKSFFPQERFLEHDLNNFYQARKISIFDTKQPYLIQRELDKEFFEFEQDGYGDTRYFGGYGENRSDIWKGTYLDESGGYIHLGIDIDNDYYKPVVCPFDCVILNKYTDTDEKIGWGGRLIIQSVNKGTYLLVVAHLDPKSLTKKINGELIKKGEILGHVGTWPSNGNTFHHIHIQCFHHRDILRDGYGFKEDLTRNPNPFNIEF